jgi:hypothetical protein
MRPGVFMSALEVRSDGVFLVKIGMETRGVWRSIGMGGWFKAVFWSDVSMTMKRT